MYRREAAEKAAAKALRAAERKRQRAAGERERNRLAQADYRGRPASRSSRNEVASLREGVVLQCPKKKLPILDLMGSVVDTVSITSHKEYP
jgi:hypothetical protein